MAVPPNGQHWPGVGEIVEAYEAALAHGDPAEVADFAPPPYHPERLSILCELVRVDLEHGWEQGRPRRLEEYRALFPAVFEDANLVHAMAYEEYRLRLQAGEAPTPKEYLRRFGIEVREWPLSPPGSPRSSVGPIPGSSIMALADGTTEMERAASAYRAYRQRGPGPPEELDFLLDSFHVPGAQAELLRSLDRTDPHAAERLAEALAGLPRAGGDFLGFRLCEELGRGAFGRVFLARQGELADRLVALKVSADVAGESHALARLQHTNVVPIYSVHRCGALQAVCMPYLGATTLADTLTSLRSQDSLPRSGAGLLSSLRSRKTVAMNAGSRATGNVVDGMEAKPDFPESAAREPEVISQPRDEPPPPQVERLRCLGYVPAVLWVAARVADGLAHAHERGILHRDLKPANILFADDSEPVLLDFNLAADTRTGVGAAVALVGGTLPYMAPEQLRAFRDGTAAVDARSDVYALGVILYELLTGVPPFPVRTGSVDALLPKMIADRLGPVPDVRRANAAVSPAVASIVLHCLEPDPDRRYRSARELQEDLRRQLDDLPLRHAPEPSLRERVGKWARRHPRLTSATSVGVVAICLLVAVGSAFLARQRHLRQLEAADSFRRLSDEVRQADVLLGSRDADPNQIEEGVALCRDAVGRFRVLEDPSWLSSPLVTPLPDRDRRQLHEDMGLILFLWARTVGWQAEATVDATRQAALIRSALRMNTLAESGFGRGAAPRAWWLLQRADLERLAGRSGEAQRLRQQAESVPLGTPKEQLLALSDRIGLVPRREALSFLQEASRTDPQNFANWLRLGNLYVQLGKMSDRTSYFDEAEQCYGIGIALRPNLYWAYLNRGLLYLDLRDYNRAREDFDRVIALRPDLTRAYVNRALARLGLKDFQGAADDLTRALKSKDAPARVLFLRARARLGLGDREGAARDHAAGLQREPNDPVSWVVRGRARLPSDPHGALADFDAALALNPRYIGALQNKANVLSEHLGRIEEAVRVLDVALEHHPGYVKALAGRGVLLARLGRRDAAARDVRASLTLDDGALTVYQAACVSALTSKQEPADRAEALRLLAEAFRKDGSLLAVALQDPDLDPLRDQPGFRDLLQALEVVVPNGTIR
jgi:serine/threonine protein kinase/tetratricopeptide (TPR) repeat protein